MADLVTHTCVAFLVKAGWDRYAPPATPQIATFVLGTCLPDLLGRVPSMGLTWLRWSAPWIPEWLVYVWGPLHMPIGIAIAAYTCAFVFPEANRRASAWNLLGGGMLHMGVDLLQHHFGVGYLLLFPFSWWDYEVGCIGSEDTVKIVPVLVPITLLVAWLRRRTRVGDRPVG